jgi:hypothetical protein
MARGLTDTKLHNSEFNGLTTDSPGLWLLYHFASAAGTIPIGSWLTGL